ncbi:MAG: hypothetical protein AAFS10_02055 [Myxococcota bacterium]
MSLYKIPEAMDWELVGPVRVHHQGQANYVTTEEQMWILKEEDDDMSLTIAAEAVGYLLGLYLGVPLPEARWSRRDGKTGGLSRQIKNGPSHWEPTLWDAVINQTDLGRILALDAIIANGDRHERNILLEEGPAPDHYTLWAIDQGAAEISSPELLYSRDCAPPKVTSELIDGFEVQLIRDEALRSANIARNLGEDVLKHIARHACDVSCYMCQNQLLKVLRQRCRDAPYIVEGYLNQVEARP